MKYYVDGRIGRIVTKEYINKNFLAPELYYEYRGNNSTDVIIETWSVSENEVIDFVYSIPEKESKSVDLNKKRQVYFESHGVKPYRLKAYSVPNDWFIEEINKLNTRKEK